MTVIEAPAKPVIDPGVEDDAAVLDNLVPDWFERIDLDRLNLASCTHCILGQLYGNYNNVADLFLDRPGRRGGRFAEKVFEQDWKAAILWRRETR